MGYHRAGFTEIVGVDIKPQKRYPFTFVQGDALEYVAAHGREFDAIHASPPCQAYSALKSMWNAREHPDLVEPTRGALIATGLPYVIENVPGAPLGHSVVLCGTAFGLGTADGVGELRRHRVFETHPHIGLVPPCRHGGIVIGVYGGHGRDRRRAVTVLSKCGGTPSKKRAVGVYGNARGRSVRDGTQQFPTHQRREAMGIDWMTGDERSQAIPPAYTEFIGKQLLRAIAAKRTA